MTALGRGVGALPRWLVLSIGALALLVVLGLPTIVIPFATDQVWFALGARTILDGNQLYADFWDQKPPLIYLLYAIPFALAGEHMEAVRVFDLLNVVAGMAGVFFLGRRLFGERSGIFAAALYAFAYLSWTQPGDLGETESFMAAPLAFAFALYLPDDARPDAPLRAIAAGLLLSVAFSFKAPALLFLLGLPAAELLLRREEGWSASGAAGRLALAVVGFAVVQAALALYLAVGGVVDDFIDIQRNYTAHYNAYRYPSGAAHVRFLLQGTSDFVTRTPFLVVPAAVALFFAFFRPRESRGVTLLALLALLGVASVWWQGKMFTYHWVVMVPLLAPLAGYALDRLGALFATLPRGRALGAWLLLAAGLIVLAYPTLRDTYDDYRVLVRYADGSMSRREVEAHYYPLYTNNHDLVDYVRANSGESDQIYVWGLWPQVEFWLNDREPFNRFTVNSGMRATWSPQKYRDELMRDLRAAPPRYFAIGLGDNQPWLVGTSQTSDEYIRDDFPELELFLEENYDLVRNFGPMVLLERRPVAV